MADYSYWQRALAITGGKRPLTRPEMSSLGISEDDVGCGFFRMRSVPRGPFVQAAAIWEMVVGANEDPDIFLNVMCATVNAEEASPDAIWLAACKFPVTEAAYRARIEGGSWTDDEKENT